MRHEGSVGPGKGRAEGLEGAVLWQKLSLALEEGHSPWDPVIPPGILKYLLPPLC